MEAAATLKRSSDDDGAESAGTKKARGAVLTYKDYSFAMDQPAEAHKFFLEQGFVVLRGAQSVEASKLAEDEFFDTLSRASGGKFLRHRRCTWGNENMPFDHKGVNNFSRGFVGIVHSAAQWRARSDPKIRAFFGRLLGTEAVWPSFDRMGFMRPGHKYRTEEYFLHWDQNPLKDPDFCRVQGVLALKDCPEEVGGFQCVPGSHKDFVERAGKFARAAGGHAANVSNNTAGDIVKVPEGEEGYDLWIRRMRVPVKRGDLIIWDSRTAHGNFPNSCKPDGDYRLVSYLTFGTFPAEKEWDLRRLRRASFDEGVIEKSNRAAFFSGFQSSRWTAATPERNRIPTESVTVRIEALNGALGDFPEMCNLLGI